MSAASDSAGAAVAAIGQTVRLPRRAWGAYGYGAILAVWSVLALAYRDPLYDEFAVGASILLAAMTLGFLWWRPHPGREGFRFLGVCVSGQAFLATGLSVLQGVDRDALIFAPVTEAFSFAVEISLVFSLMFLVGAFISAPRASEYRPPPTGDEVRGLTPSVGLALAVLTAASTANFALRTSAESASRFGTLPLVILNPGLVVPLLVASSLLKRQKHVLAIGILLGGHLLITFMTSAIGAAAIAIRDVVLAHLYLRRRLPWKTLAVGVLAVVVLNPAKMIFRNLVAQDGEGSRPATSLVEAAGFWENALEATWASDGRGEHNSRDRLEETGRRLDYNWVAAHIYTMVPDKLPFEMGGTYEDVPTVLVPRLLYPDKPLSSLHTRSRWLVKLGIQSWERAMTTAVAIPAPAEAYWNFGWAGVVVVPIVLGLMVGAMLRLAPSQPVAGAAYIVVLGTVLGQFLDMLVWYFPAFVVIGAAAVLARIYCALGRRRLRRRGEVPARA